MFKTLALLAIVWTLCGLFFVVAAAGGWRCR